MSPIRDYLPFASRPRPPTPNVVHFVARAPFVVVFVATAWILFLQLVRGNGWIHDGLRPHIGFIPDLWLSDPGRAFVAANVGLIVQHSWGQIIYVSLLLLLVGSQFEVRFGFWRTLATFYGACLVGIMVLTSVILFTAVNGPHGWSHQIATTSWSGASVGGFGLLGATVATARRPYALVGAWLLYEALVEWTLVPGLAVTMHAAGFTFGFVATRVGLTFPTPVADEPQPVPDDGDREG